MSLIVRLILLACALLQGVLAAPSTNRQAPVNNTLMAEDTQIGCTSGKVDNGELQQALACFSAWCNTNKVSPHAGDYCAVGSSMMYICSYGGWNPCDTAELVTAWGAIQRDCGPGTGGWWYHPDWQKTYGIDTVGADVCGNLFH